MKNKKLLETEHHHDSNPPFLDTPYSVELTLVFDLLQSGSNGKYTQKCLNTQKWSAVACDARFAKEIYFERPNFWPAQNSENVG